MQPDNLLLVRAVKDDASRTSVAVIRWSGTKYQFMWLKYRGIIHVTTVVVLVLLLEFSRVIFDYSE